MKQTLGFGLMALVFTLGTGTVSAATVASAQLKDAVPQSIQTAVAPVGQFSTVGPTEDFTVGGRFGGGFKSIKTFKLPSRTTGSSVGASGNSTTFYSPGFLPFTFLPIPIFGGHGDSFLTLIILALVIIWAVSFFRKRLGGQKQLSVDAEEKDEIGVLFDQCRKNLDTITEDYLKAQQSLEVLHGKIPENRYQDMNEDFSSINLQKLETELADIKTKMDGGHLAAARPLLYSFDEEAEKIYHFLDELNQEAKGYLRAS